LNDRPVQNPRTVPAQPPPPPPTRIAPPAETRPVQRPAPAANAPAPKTNKPAPRKENDKKDEKKKEQN
jgi:hypothetical protein